MCYGFALLVCKEDLCDLVKPLHPFEAAHVSVPWVDASRPLYRPPL
ncbi:hypothetical protein GMOD_00006221 [Pyrenophora seminiperda CCB06]|uniref:Uncharacterized protein n=1 Tax=Pyrenophora seminiperda CCB06 TaxID=1302712 RepID=A0A3M7M4H4_9PLEO|nr:hypothetical protein GMOD_00006221 [Pyrenophora seminiperda CCB06]